MRGVNVLINIPASKLDKSYTYSIPDELENQVEFGKRVLVELGRKKVEAYIIDEDIKIDSTQHNIKPIIKVLDIEPVFDEKLFKLAEWIAETYLCPISSALNAMLPRILTRKRDEVIIPNITRDKAYCSRKDIIESYPDFFEDLWEKGEVSLSSARRNLGVKAIKLLEDEGLILLSGTYSGYRPSKTGYIYKVDNFDPVKDMQVLVKRAPRQAEAMQLLMEQKSIAREVMDKLIPSNSLKALLSKGYICIEKYSDNEYADKPILTDEQVEAVEKIEQALKRGYSEFLLYGVTGSGKSEVYLSAVEKCIQCGKKAILLVPEIALTRHLIEMFSLRIKDIAVLHSSMSQTERYDEWKRIRKGEVNLVIGTRSAIFAPLPDLGLIIIDEEQENTYKQEETPRYHAIEAARKRAEIESAVLLSGSATPSLETFYRAMNDKIRLLTLKSRIGEAKMPVINIEDMRQKNKEVHNNAVISAALQNKIAANLSRHEQCILFLNRRGYSPMTICRECGNIATCPHCSVSMTFHSDLNKNICHYCNYQADIPVKCSICGSKHLQQIGFGTQRVEEEVKRLFPAARIARLDIDISRKKGMQKEILDKMNKKEIDILVGTQMVAKGFNFPSVSLVGIVDADGMLNLPDFRAGERAFQLIVQAAGRAGRGSLPGEVVIQTYKPDNMIIEVAARQDYPAFYYEEIKLRKLLNYPPFTNILRLVLSSEQEPSVISAASDLAEQIREITDAKEDNLDILGPASCPISRMRNKFRYQVIVKSDNMLLLRSIGKYIIDNKKVRSLQLEVDINPLMIM